MTANEPALSVPAPMTKRPYAYLVMQPSGEYAVFNNEEMAEARAEKTGGTCHGLYVRAALSVPSDAEVEDVCRRLEAMSNKMKGAACYTLDGVVAKLRTEAAALIRKLHARAVEAEAAATELKQENQLLGEQLGSIADENERLSTELATARDLLREAGEALEPIARVASGYDSPQYEDEDYWVCLGAAIIKIGHLRRARDVLTKIKGPTMAADTATLSALRDRVLAAAGPDRGLDADLHWHLLCVPYGGHEVRDGVRMRDVMYECRNDGGKPDWRPWWDDSVARYTGSVDAAAALVGRMLPGSVRESASEGKAEIVWPYGDGNWGIASQEAATEPLAILAALLSALIDREGE